ncbi:hypothetical protein GCM10023328_08210 [Modestobacter marinus]|uniref:Uncharacterized protein n=1 Tax=Modestobacter marinus TaxID=477641 RepID=A0A846LN28_9ACTN|nr:hypothetical protein [Modestobacter marinus]NIH66758.1 hypothetical protein [Modestobacter marinus]GGL48925.1 hypothetical protein GCM10011589_01750 [Modestobacter marinus]
MLTVIRPRRLVAVLTGAVVLLGAVSLTLNLLVLQAADSPAAGLLDLLSVNREGNLPTWFSSALLLSAAAAVAGVGAWAHRVRDRWRWHWTVLAAVFGYLSVDELVRLHERANHQVGKVVEPTGVFTFGWWLLAAPLVLLFAAAYVRFLRGLPGRIGLLMVVAGTLYVGGAIGMEMVGSWLADDRGTLLSTPYVLATTAEEVFEMLGVVVFLYAVTTYANSRMTVVDVPVAPAAALPVQAPDRAGRGRGRAAAGAGTAPGAVDSDLGSSRAA